MNDEKFTEVAEKLEIEPADLNKISKKMKFAKYYYPIIQVAILTFSILLLYLRQEVRPSNYPYYDNIYKIKTGSIIASYAVLNLGNIGFSARYFWKLRKKGIGIIVTIVNTLISLSAGLFVFSTAIMYSVFFHSTK